MSDREAGDSADVFLCLDATTGAERWSVRYAAPGKLDYGNSPRSTPLVVGDRVYLTGAHGHVTAVDFDSGRIVWQRNLFREFGLLAELKWGYCASPLIVGGKLILYAGGPQGALVAVDPETGETAWKTPGRAPGYGSLIAGELGGKLQIVGHDAERLVGWDAVAGKELWSVEPELPGDFNVPTPLIHEGRLLVFTEGNSTRLFAFADGGAIVPKPVGVFARLAPGTHTPVMVGDRLFGVHEALYCLRPANEMQLIYRGKDKALRDHANLIAARGKVLIVTGEAELILLDAAADSYQPLGRVKLLPDEGGLLSHPALAGDKLYVRGARQIVAVDLGAG